MLKRSWPRSSTSAVTGNGSSSTSVAPFFPVKNAASSCSVPRATVPSTSGRALEPSAKNALVAQRLVLRLVVHVLPAARPRSAQRTRSPAAATAARSLRLNFVDLLGVEPLEELARRAARSNFGSAASIARKNWSRLRARERAHVEHRVIRLGSPFSTIMPITAGQRREQDRQLEGRPG